MAGRSHPQRVDVGAEALRGAPGATEDPLRLRLWLDEREDALTDGLLAERVENARLPSCLDVLGDLAEGELSQRLQVLAAEEVRERRLDPVTGVDLPCLDPLLQRLG